MMGPTRRCRTCDVAWTGSEECWLCGRDGAGQGLYVPTGPNLAAGWPTDNIEDFVWGIW